MNLWNKRLTTMVFITGASWALLAGCGMTEGENQTQTPIQEEPIQEISIQETPVQETSVQEETKDSQEPLPIHGDLYVTIYEEGNVEQIKNWVDEIGKSSSSLREEVERVESLSDEYMDLLQEYYTQADMNMISYCSLQVWDAELNNLWGRMSGELEAQTKEELLKNLRIWNATKEDYMVASIGKREEGGSIYPSLYNSLMEDMTRKKVHMLADKYADFLGESYEMPVYEIGGYYVNCEGTTDVYDELSIAQSGEGGFEVEIGLYRITTLNGTATKSGDVLHYTDSEYDLTGTITCGWNEATFTVETSTFEYLKPGDIFVFDTVY